MVRLHSVKLDFSQDFSGQYMNGEVATSDGLLDRDIARDLKEDVTDFILMMGAKYGFEVKDRCVQL